MPSKLEKELMAGAADRRKPEQTDALVAGTIFGKMGQESAAPTILKLSQLVRSRFQSRGRRDEAYMENLVESIRIEGLLDPIIVRPLPAQEGCHTMTPRFELVAGHHRVDAFEILGRAEIPAFVRNLSDAEAARALTSENTTRKALGDWELYRHMVMLRQAGAVNNNSELARVLNIHRTIVPALDAFAVFPQSAHELLDDHPELVGYNLAQKLKPFCEQHSLLVFDALVLLAKGKLSQAAVPGWVDEKVKPRPKKMRKDLELGHGVRLVVTDDGARVSGDLDYEALSKLVEEHLPSLLKTHQK